MSSQSHIINSTVNSNLSGEKFGITLEDNDANYDEGSQCVTIHHQMCPVQNVHCFDFKHKVNFIYLKS